MTKRECPRHADLKVGDTLILKKDIVTLGENLFKEGSTVEITYIHEDNLLKMMDKEGRKLFLLGKCSIKENTKRG